MSHLLGAETAKQEFAPKALAKNMPRGHPLPQWWEHEPNPWAPKAPEQGIAKERSLSQCHQEQEPTL